jgi:hypothetical protein
MRISRFLISSILSVIILSFYCCKNEEKSHTEFKVHSKFDINSMIVKESNSLKKVQGQVLYLPVYSNVPYFKNNKEYSLSAFVTIHNTDFYKNLKITKVLFFDNDGLLVSNYLKKDTTLLPLAAINYFVPYEDKSGTGANFIIEWVADTLINEPLIESVMLNLVHGQGVSFTSTGKILREIK